MFFKSHVSISYTKSRLFFFFLRKMSSLLAAPNEDSHCPGHCLELRKVSETMSPSAHVQGQGQCMGTWPVRLQKPCAQKGTTLGLCSAEPSRNPEWFFFNKGPTFSFCIGPHKGSSRLVQGKRFSSAGVTKSCDHHRIPGAVFKADRSRVNINQWQWCGVIYNIIKWQGVLLFFHTPTPFLLWSQTTKWLRNQN